MGRLKLPNRGVILLVSGSSILIEPSVVVKKRHNFDRRIDLLNFPDALEQPDTIVFECVSSQVVFLQMVGGQIQHDEPTSLVRHDLTSIIILLEIAYRPGDISHKKEKDVTVGRVSRQHVTLAWS